VRTPLGPVFVLAVAVAQPAAGPAWAAEPQVVPVPAQDLYELGMVHFRTRSFAEAAKAFEAAYALDPRREVLFALAQATRLSGDCPAAVPLYQRFLATRPPDHQVEATRLALARCEDRPAPAGTLARPAPPPSVRTTSTTPEPRRWYRDPVAGALAAAGVLSFGAGMGLLVSARAADREHREALVYERAEERRSVAGNRQRWAAGVLLSAAVLGLAAGARGWWLQYSNGGAGVGVGASF
jgi:tetratricopeptide (TPR) repeat protein